MIVYLHVSRASSQAGKSVSRWQVRPLHRRSVYIHYISSSRNAEGRAVVDTVASNSHVRNKGQGTAAHHDPNIAPFL